MQRRGGRWGLRTHLLVAALTTDFRSGVEEDFDFSMRKDDGPDVSAFHYDAAASAEFLLQTNHPGANCGEDADARSSIGDGGVANEASDVFPIEENAVVLIARIEADRGFPGEKFEGSGLIERNFVAQSLEGEGTIHGAGFEIEQTEMPGEVPGDGGFARSGGTVDGDDWLPVRLKRRRGVL